MKRLLLCFLVLALSIPLFANDKPLLAVTAITANGVAEADATACRSIVETALFKPNFLQS
ncbi:MAG: hypothetical protein PQJ61_16075 [Spirochaetales bacterium]|uniref:Uncharacterized protein n=1 Tax=Candidatus Thalassospirochaeta sargassi TaxID=3119039 RepID=A0AAJ1IFD0_9SPIO|nr:hypothetical protein [Spirochaetales bacterium]